MDKRGDPVGRDTARHGETREDRWNGMERTCHHNRHYGGGVPSGDGGGPRGVWAHMDAPETLAGVLNG